MNNECASCKTVGRNRDATVRLRGVDYCTWCLTNVVPSRSGCGDEPSEQTKVGEFVSAGPVSDRSFKGAASAAGADIEPDAFNPDRARTRLAAG